MSRFVLGAALALSVSASGLCMQEPDGPSFSEVQLSDQLVFLRANTSISNPSTLIYRDEAFTLVVDPGLAPTQHLLADYVDGAAPVYSVTTHGHRDHAEATTALPAPRTVIAPAFLLEEEEAAEGVVHLTLHGELRLESATGDVLIGQLPASNGHTGGDLWIWFEDANVLAVGDYYFLRRYPIIDVDWGGSVEGYFRNIEWMLERFPADATLVPGHSSFGPAPAETASMEDWRNWMDDVRASMQTIRDWSAEGLSRDEIVERGLPERFAYLTERPAFRNEERWIDFVLETASEG